MSRYLLITDFDGILSTGMFQDIHGRISKRIACGNKEARKLLEDNNIDVVCVTSQSSLSGLKITEDVCERLGIKLLKSDTNKREVIERIISEHDFPNCIGYVGDDYYDASYCELFDVMFIPKSSKSIRDLFFIINPLVKESSSCVMLDSDKPFLEACLRFIDFINNK